MLGMLDAVFALVLEQICGEGSCGNRVLQIILAPAFVGSIEMNGSGCSAFLQTDVSGGFHELNDVVAVLHSLLQIVSGAFRFCELVVIGDEPVQSLQHPQEDALRFCCKLLRKVRIIHTALIQIPYGYGDLTPMETVRTVI